MDGSQIFSFNVSSNTSGINLVAYSLWEVIAIATVTAIVSVITIIGNVLVLLSFKVNSQLKTVNNYYLLSLAFADLIIGVFSMNLYTSYILMGYWSLGNLACDLWLALDYVASNASVMNLLVISFDRYFSITRPLTYRAKRTPKHAAIMIGLAWLVSLILWAPPILCWQYFVGKRTVPERQCQIQFFSEPVITFGTAIAAFYIPVSVMTILYCRIYKETERRTKDLAELQEVNHSIDSDNKTCTQTAIFRSRKQDQGSWLSSSQSKSVISSTTFSDEWSKADQLGYASLEDEERPMASRVLLVYRNQACGDNNTALSINREQKSSHEDRNFFPSPVKSNLQKNKKSISYRFQPASKGSTSPDIKNGNTKASRSSFSSRDSISKPVDSTLKSQITKCKRIVLIKERKAAQTLSAILLAFILTWTPYNIMVLISTFCSNCIPLSLWHLGYWLCYVNSTINPMCYALCNKTFQKTFRMLLLCQWKKKKEEEKLYWYGQNPVVGSK